MPIALLCVLGRYQTSDLFSSWVAWATGGEAFTAPAWALAQAVAAPGLSSGGPQAKMVAIPFALLVFPVLTSFPSRAPKDLEPGSGLSRGEQQ